MKKLIYGGFITILILTLYVTVFGGGQDLEEMWSGTVLQNIVIGIQLLGLLLMGYGIVIILLTWISAIIRWVKK